MKHCPAARSLVALLLISIASAACAAEHAAVLELGAELESELPISGSVQKALDMVTDR